MRRKTDPLVVASAALCLLCTIVTVAVVAPTVLDTSRTTTQIQEGRRAGQQITCAANAAVIDAGRSVITGHAPGKPPATPPPAVERTLRKLGYPPFAVRQQQAERAGDEYGRQIARAIQRATRVKGLVKRDGTLDCERLAAATGIK